MKKGPKSKTPQKYYRSSKSIKDKNRKHNTQNSNTFIQGYTPDRPTRKQSVSFAQSKSGSKSRKNNNSRHYLSKSKYSDDIIEEHYYTPSKDNDDIHYLVHPKFNKKFTSKKQEQGIKPFVDAAKKLVSKSLIQQAGGVLQAGLLINPNSSTLNYFLAMCYLMSDDYPNAIRLFKQQLITHPKKSLFILLAVCYKKLNEYESALELLNSCLQKDSKFYDGFVQRGRLYMKLRKFDKANHDFEQAILINEHKLIAYILKGDCLRKNNKFQLALKMYKKAQKIQKSNSLALRKIFCTIELGQYEQALLELNKGLGQNPKNGQFLFAKGLYYKKIQQYLQAYDYFNLALYNNSSKHLSSRCLYQMGKITLLSRDYSKTMQILSTFPDNHILGNKQIQRLKKMCEAIICLIKDEIQEGMKILNIIPKQYGITQSLSSLFYSCKTYGHMKLKQFEEARINLLKLQKYQTLSCSNLYNKYICEGILSWKEQKCEQSLAYFTKSTKIVPNKIQPYYYKAITLIQFILSSKSEDKKKQYLINALKIIKRQQSPNRKQEDLMLLRGVLEFYTQNYKNSQTDINTVLKTNKNSVLGLYLKGLLLGKRQYFGQAIKYFNAALQLNGSKQYPEIYLNRAKCHILQMNQKKAFSDLQQYVSQRIVQPDVHQYAGQFLYQIGAYEDAAKAYSNISDLKNNIQILQQRYYCHVSSYNFQFAIKDIDNLLIIQDNKRLRFDKKILQLLQKSTQSVNREGESPEQIGFQHQDLIKSMKQAKVKFPQFGNVFDYKNYKIIKGIFYFYCGEYERALSNFQKVVKMKDKQISSSRIKKKKIIVSSYIHLNMAICHLMIHGVVKAVGQLKLLRQKSNDETIRNDTNILIETVKRDMISSEKNKGKQKKVIEFFPFNKDNGLCCFYPKIKIPSATVIQTRLYFDIPHINVSPIKVVFDQKILNTINFNWIQMRPQASWIGQNKLGTISNNIQSKIEQLQNESGSASDDYQFEDRQEEDEHDQYSHLGKSKFRANLQSQIKNSSKHSDQQQQFRFKGYYQKQFVQNNEFKQINQNKTKKNESLNNSKQKKQNFFQQQKTNQKHHKSQRKQEIQKQYYYDQQLQEQKQQQGQFQEDELQYQQQELERQKQYQIEKLKYQQLQFIRDRHIRQQQRQYSEEQQEQEQQQPLPFNPKKWAEDMKLGKQFQQKFKRVVGNTKK